MGLMYWLYAIAFVIVHSHLLLLHVQSTGSTKVYIVQLKQRKIPTHFTSHTQWHYDLLQSHTSATQDQLLYSYKDSYNGFAAKLTLGQVESLRQSDSIFGVYEDTIYTDLHTTRTPEFLGLNNPNLWEDHTVEELNIASHEVIIGVLDTGVWPESDSFKDHDMPNVPPRWRGECAFQNKSYCNKKLIGARFFSKGLNMTKPITEEASPQDNDGHGTHTSSTATGSWVENASLFGSAKGNARGVAYKARLAVYKVFWKPWGAAGSDILGAIDSAIDDGVHGLSISIGYGPVSPFNYTYAIDPLAIGAFMAMEKGIFVSCSAGNYGSSAASVTNVAPWLMTVGAGTLDRDFPAYAALGNNKTYRGLSLHTGKGMGGKFVKLVYPGGNRTSSNLCLARSLDRSIVRGKVVVCDRGNNSRVQKSAVVRDAGGVAMILANTKENGGEELLADIHFLPALAIGMTAGDKIKQYVKKTMNPTVMLGFRGTVVKVKPSPVVAAFSSRGPNTITPEILKPDVIGPGVNILAAWPGTVPPTEVPGDKRKTNFNIVSGTSMSCPHISGLAALLKAAHPKWSPSAIKSALMTTAYTVDNTNSPLRDAANNMASNPLAHGAGHVNLHGALTPGLVYDATVDDYIAFLCTICNNTDYIQRITHRSNINCHGKLDNPGDLNYPSFSVIFPPTSTVASYKRELTNVDDVGSTYNVSIENPANVKVIVEPSKLVFKNLGDKQRFTITFRSQNGVRQSSVAFGSITWNNPKNQVKSPISVTWM